MIWRFALPAALLPGVASAHAFEAGADSYALLLQGVAEPYLVLPVTLMLVGLGLAAAIWREEGMLAIWPGLGFGLLAGVGFGAFLPEMPIWTPFVSALVLGVLGVAALPVPTAVMAGLSALVAAVAGRILLESHGFGELPLAFLIGLWAGAASVVALTAGLVQASRQVSAHPAILIGWRALSSWVGAAAILMIAVSFAGQA